MMLSGLVKSVGPTKMLGPLNRLVPLSRATLAESCVSERAPTRLAAGRLKLVRPEPSPANAPMKLGALTGLVNVGAALRRTTLGGRLNDEMTPVILAAGRIKLVRPEPSPANAPMKLGANTG